MMSPWRRTKRLHRRGYALLAVLIFLAVSLSFVAVNQRRLDAVLRVERASLLADDFSDGPVRATGLALALLESGLPPTNPYECGVRLTTAAGDRCFSVQFTSAAPGTWSVHVTPVDDLTGLTPLPAAFTN
jgi:hypothetical protein